MHTTGTDIAMPNLPVLPWVQITCVRLLNLSDNGAQMLILSAECVAVRNLGLKMRLNSRHGEERH